MNNNYKNLLLSLFFILTTPQLIARVDTSQQEQGVLQQHNVKNTISTMSSQSCVKDSNDVDQQSNTKKRASIFKLGGAGFVAGIVIGAGYLFVGPVLALAGGTAVLLSSFEIMS